MLKSLSDDTFMDTIEYLVLMSECAGAGVSKCRHVMICSAGRALYSLWMQTLLSVDLQTVPDAYLDFCRDAIDAMAVLIVAIMSSSIRNKFGTAVDAEELATNVLMSLATLSALHTDNTSDTDFR